MGSIQRWQVRQAIAKYGQLLRGEMDGGQLWRELKMQKEKLKTGRHRGNQGQKG